MVISPKERISVSCRLMEDFAARTGIAGGENQTQKRYLWTDAFAVQTFFNLAHATGNQLYFQLAERLIKLVHQSLGRYHPLDSRIGWISGLSEEEGIKHPTAGGLRIGKKLPERKPTEPFDEQLEWERDGQYFHYLTRWMHALLQAQKETGEKIYAQWANDLLVAGSKFIYKVGDETRMYWKMSTDLSRPLINSMGAHDPLEGIICALAVKDQFPENWEQLSSIIQDFKNCGKKLSWITSDPLGIGGLLLNVAKVLELSEKNIDLPGNATPERILKECMQSLEMYKYNHEAKLNAKYRLAFRECGLSLGLRTVGSLKGSTTESRQLLEQIKQYTYLADDIEVFWMDEQNQQSTTWKEHIDINAVTLAASLAA